VQDTEYTGVEELSWGGRPSQSPPPRCLWRLDHHGGWKYRISVKY